MISNKDEYLTKTPSFQNFLKIFKISVDIFQYPLYNLFCCERYNRANNNVRLAQLDRASDYGSEGREFESSIARYRDCKEISLQSFLYLWKISLQRILSEQTPKNLPKIKQRRCQIQVHCKQTQICTACPDII